jgi:hypothetical protein
MEDVEARRRAVAGEDDIAIVWQDLVQLGTPLDGGSEMNTSSGDEDFDPA